MHKIVSHHMPIGGGINSFKIRSECAIILVLIALSLTQSVGGGGTENDLPKDPNYENKAFDLKKILVEIGGMDVEDEIPKDELKIEYFTQDELEEYLKANPIMEDFKEQNLFDEEEEETTLKGMHKEMIKKVSKIRHELLWHTTLQILLQSEITEEVIPAFHIANDLFYKIKDLNEFEGINQNLRDYIVKLIKQARENINIIKKVWNKNRSVLRGKLLRPLDQISESLEKIFEFEDLFEDIDEGDEEATEAIWTQLEKEEAELTDSERDFLEFTVEDVEEQIKNAKKQEAHYKKMLSTFLGEERNLIRLGINLWINSEVDAPPDDEDHYLQKEQEKAKEPENETNEKQNRIRRMIITEMNLNRAKVKNETDTVIKNKNTDNSKSKEDKAKKPSIKADRQEL